VEPGGDLDRAWEAYERALDARRMWDFDDLVSLAVALLEERPEALAEMRRRWPYVSIDEYQDVDDRQYRLVRLLAPADANVCAIGDPDQALYGFRGADVGFFLRFRDDYPAARLCRITRNYRSTRAILDGALRVIAPSPTLGERVIRAGVEGAFRIATHEAPTERAEAEFVVHTVERMIGGSTFFSMDSGRVASSEGEADHAFSDFAVLYRTDAQADAVAEALTRSGMPFQRRSHRRLAEGAAIDALAAALRAAPPLLPLPLGERLKTAAAELREQVARPGAAEGALTEADVDAALGLLLPMAARAGGDVGRFLLEVATGVEIDAWDPRAARISLLTLHASKGLEFRVVFLVGSEDGLLPLRFPGQEPDVDEERRLFYVGMTRAKERLFLTHARTRARRGAVAEARVSPFVRDVGEALLEVVRGEPAAKRGPKQLALF
jgi:DNA helicase-2/ATP-dependent DNA helicase PcrA